MIILVIVLVPATVLTAAWFWLLGQVTREDWVTAAYNRVLDGRLEEERAVHDGCSCSPLLRLWRREGARPCAAATWGV